MSVVSTITLRDDYTSKANRIAQSSSKMGRAMQASARTAKQAGGALKSAFDRSYEVKVNRLNLASQRRSVMQMEDSLRKVTGKPYEVKITANRSVGEQVKRNLGAIKTQAQSTASSVTSAFSRVKVNTSAFIKARQDARSLQNELKRMTGRRHRVTVGVAGRTTLLGKITGQLKRLTGRRHKVQVDVQSKGLGVLGKLGGGLAKAGGLALGAGTAMLGGGIASKGFNRWRDTDNAQAKMRGLGYDEKEVGTIMDNALASVKGTHFGLGEAATTAAGAVAAGATPGEELENTLKVVANSAAAAGTNMDEMGAIFNKGRTAGIVQNDILNQVADRGVPIYAKLAETMGVAQESVKDMAARGEISYQDFEKAMAEASGNVAKEMANTFDGAKDNFGAALGRIGVNLLGGAFDKLVPSIQAATTWIEQFEEPAAKLGERIGELASGAFAWMQENGEKIGAVFAEIGGVVGPLLKGAFSIIGAIATSIVVPALSILGGIVKDVVWPAFKILANVVAKDVMPFLSKLASVVGSVVMPVFEAVAKVVGGVVATAFKGVASAVESAVGALKGLGRRIGNILDRLPFFGADRNASGTTYHRGGVTKINELGGEAWKLPEGTKIYPSGKTTEMIKKEVIKPGPSRNESKVVTLAPVFHIYGSKNDHKPAIDDIRRELKRLAVTV